MSDNFTGRDFFDSRCSFCEWCVLLVVYCLQTWSSGDVVSTLTYKKMQPWKPVTGMTSSDSMYTHSVRIFSNRWSRRMHRSLRIRQFIWTAFRSVSNQTATVNGRRRAAHLGFFLFHMWQKCVQLCTWFIVGVLLIFHNQYFTRSCSDAF